MGGGSVRRYITNLALKLVGTPYIWGGSTPRGFDCSGLVVWILQAVEILPSGDWTADGLRKAFKRTELPKSGDLALYGTQKRATHIMVHLDSGLVCGASGGDSTTTTEEEAKRKGAMVKVKPLLYRGDYLYSVDVEQPTYS